MNIDIDEPESTPDSYKATTLSFAERQSILNTMLSRESDPRHQEMLEQVDAAYRLIDESDSKLVRREELLVNASKTGVLKNVEDAEIALTAAQQSKKDAENALKIQRGDYTDDYPAAKLTQSIKPTNNSAPGAELSRAEQSPARSASVAASGDALIPLPAVANWKMQVQTEATALVLRLRKSGANPTKHSIIDPMARWCRENGIKTDSGIYPKEGYLRTHVLGGKHWDVPN
jgi:hypothetical protein